MSRLRTAAAHSLRLGYVPLGVGDALVGSGDAEVRVGDGDGEVDAEVRVGDGDGDGEVRVGDGAGEVDREAVGVGLVLDRVGGALGVIGVIVGAGVPGRGRAVGRRVGRQAGCVYVVRGR